MKLGKQLKRIRKSRGLKQKDLAKMIDMTAIHYNSVEKDRHNTTITALEKIAKVTNTQLVIVFIDKEEL